MPSPWHHWYHCTTNTYGTWLPGDPRGWRTIHHRQHVEGDYHNPPPQGSQTSLHDAVRSSLKRDPVVLDDEAQSIVLRIALETLQRRSIPVAAAALDDHHLHIVMQTADDRPRHWLGLAKKTSSHTLKQHNLAPIGGVWARRSLCTPIADQSHFDNAVRYVQDHAARGAHVWSPQRGLVHPDDPPE